MPGYGVLGTLKKLDNCHNNRQSDSDYDQITHFPATGEYCKWSEHNREWNDDLCKVTDYHDDLHSEYLLPKHKYN